MTEAELQSAVIDMAQMFGWLVHHARPARTRDGSWRTHIQGDPGFPDLVLVRGGVVWFVELKSEKGRLTDGQRRWSEELGAVVWRPSDWTDGTIERILRPVRVGGS